MYVYIYIQLSFKFEVRKYFPFLHFLHTPSPLSLFGMGFAASKEGYFTHLCISSCSEVTDRE